MAAEAFTAFHPAVEGGSARCGRQSIGQVSFFARAGAFVHSTALVCAQRNLTRAMTCGLRELHGKLSGETAKGSKTVWAGRYEVLEVIGEGGFSTMVR